MSYSSIKRFAIVLVIAAYAGLGLSGCLFPVRVGVYNNGYNDRYDHHDHHYDHNDRHDRHDR